MTGYDMTAAMSFTDTAFIEEAETARRMVPLRRWIAVAASIAVVIGGALGAWALAWEQEPTVITFMDNDVGFISACYASPSANGSTQYGVGVWSTVENHAQENVVYWLTLDVFSKTGAINFSKELAYEECARLEAAGCDIYIRDRDWIGYWGEDKHHTAICGLFTKEQLDAFPASEEYGYHFEFAEIALEDCVPFE